MRKVQVPFEIVFNGEWRRYLSFLRRHELEDSIGVDHEVAWTAIKALFQVMYDVYDLPFSNWQPGNLQLLLYRFFNTAYEREYNIQRTAEVYDSIDLFITAECLNGRLPFSFQELDDLMKPVKTEYYLPLGQQRELPEWSAYVKQSIQEYTQEWVKAFSASKDAEQFQQSMTADDFDLYALTFATQLYDRERKTLKNASKQSVKVVLMDHFAGLLLKKRDYLSIQQFLPAFLNFLGANGFMPAAHTHAMITGFDAGISILIKELENHQWYEYAKQRYAKMERTYGSDFGVDWAEAFFVNSNEFEEDYR
ncbi:hypothetical protein [Secundilactobacillus folii]|uniref:Uncharacterized protein n=1 Tax=Secundilactobacillus folii TaxID=2678357 RepID=A0A7X2XX49_9LACO|nr:hypothetical protein [Secundilactobacillus folii]MTV81936.1 hypothetical protein [Secundilactobacillus folii]